MNTINNYLNEITKNISDSLQNGMKMLEGLPQAIMRGKEVSNTYNSEKIKTR